MKNFYVHLRSRGPCGTVDSGSYSREVGVQNFFFFFFLRFCLLVRYSILNSRELNIGLMVCVARGSKASLRSI